MNQTHGGYLFNLPYVHKSGPVWSWFLRSMKLPYLNCNEYSALIKTNKEV